jgi:inosine/xanthosine triphosphatase
MKIIVSSKNPVKINSTSEAFKKVFPKEKFETVGISVSSEVSDQPMTEEETLQGAMNRANNAYNETKDADFWVGIEGGIQEINNELMTFAWVYIKTENIIGKGRSASFFLPNKIVKLIKEGKELGVADDIVFGRTNSKQKNGAVGILTNDLIVRKSLYIQPIIMALIPFKNEELYSK